jgi:hypothetical protein
MFREFYSSVEFPTTHRIVPLEKSGFPNGTLPVFTDVKTLNSVHNPTNLTDIIMELMNSIEK